MLVRKPIRFRLATDTVTSVSLIGGGSVVALDLKCASFSTSVDGSGTVTLAGDVGEQQVTMSGPGRYRADSLTSRRADIRISGGGQAGVLVSQQLGVTIAGSGPLTYAGAPHVDKEVNGSGKVIDASSPLPKTRSGSAVHKAG